MAKRKQQAPTQHESVVIEDTVVDGRGLARVDGKVVFVKGAIPGDVVDLEVVPGGRRIFLGRVLAYRQQSERRTAPACSHFGVCGGCQWQHMNYGAQLAFKQKQVADALARIGGVVPVEFRNILPAPAPYHYRNKVEFTFSPHVWLTEMLDSEEVPDPALGFHVPGNYWKVLPIAACYLADVRVDAVRNFVGEYTRKKGWAYYDLKAHSGLLRTVTLRTAEASGEMMVILNIAQPDTTVVDDLFGALRERFDFITSFVWIHNPKLNDSYTDLPWQAWQGGPDCITEQLGSYRFRISPVSFFQTNTAQAQRLYDVVRELVGPPVHTLYDLYCGAGSIGIYLAEQAQQVVGVEYVPAAIKDAEQNIQLNGLTHYRFFAGDLGKILTPEWAAQQGLPDVVVTDPPRAGMDAKVVNALHAIAPPRIVYVSCNAATQARDLALLKETYTVQVVQPVDMFPHTSHVENVALLLRKY